MAIVGFNFDKVLAERKPSARGKINIKHNLKIKDLEMEKLPIGKGEEVVKFSFEYSVDYEPKVGKLLLEGHVLFLEQPQKLKDLIKNWKKDKSILPEIRNNIFNTIFFRCNIKALNLAQDINLPPHIPLPRITPNPKDYIA